MQVLQLLSARRRRHAVSTITAARSEVPDNSEAEDDEGPFFDLDFSSVRASSSSSSSPGSESDYACSELDFIISLHRSRSASPSYYHDTTARLVPPSPELRASESRFGRNKKKKRDTNDLSFGASNKKAAFYGGRPSFASSTRSLRLFIESPTDDEEDVDASEPKRRAPSSGDVIRRYLIKISRRLRRSVRARVGDTTRGGTHRNLRKSRSASAAVATLAPSPSPSSRRDDSLVEKQDGIASAIAHCKESFHRASLSECDSSLSYGLGVILGNVKLHRSSNEVGKHRLNVPEFSQKEDCTTGLA